MAAHGAYNLFGIAETVWHSEINEAKQEEMIGHEYP
jgi:hypothetical protein